MEAIFSALVSLTGLFQSNCDKANKVYLLHVRLECKSDKLAGGKIYNIHIIPHIAKNQFIVIDKEDGTAWKKAKLLQLQSGLTQWNSTFGSGYPVTT